MKPRTPEELVRLAKLLQNADTGMIFPVHDPVGDAIVSYDAARRQEDGWFREQYADLLRLLAAIVSQAGGELKVSDTHILAIRNDPQLAFLKDIDNRQLIIRLEKETP